MKILRRVASYYRLQFSVMAAWRPSGSAALKRLILVLIASSVALVLTAALLRGIDINRPGVAVGAAILLAAFSLFIRPLLLAVFAAISILAVILATLVMQGVAFLFVAWLLPGFTVDGFVVAFFGAIVYAAFNTAILAVFGVDQDESYWGVLVQQLVTRGDDVIRTDQPGVVMIQIDGLAHPVLKSQLHAGRVPFIANWIRSGAMTLDPWEALLPSQTSASQAGILHGNNSFIPAFRWWEKDRGTLMVSNHPADAAEIVRRASDGEGLLSNNGASIGNLVSGDATRAYITMATIKDKQQGVDKSRAYYTFFLSPDNYLRAIVLAIAEMVKEYIQAARQRRRDIVPRMHRGWPYPIARAATNVILRSLGTSLVLEEMYRGTPTIYIDYTDYDEIAHHSGPERSETLDALDGVDRAIQSLVKASKAAPRPYKFIVLSDHGQSLGSTFLQRYGETLESVVSKLMGGASSTEAATGTVEEYGQMNAFLSETSRAKGVTGAVVRTALKGETTDGAIDVTPRREASATTTVPELVVCASGNLGLISFPRLPDRVTVEELNERWPGLVTNLAHHPGIGLVMVRSSRYGAVAIGPDGLRYLATDEVEGTDPVAQYGGHSADGLRRVDGMEHCPDIVAISMLDESTDEVAAFEELIGSHGGLGGAQTHPFILHPSEWQIDGPVIGAEAVYDNIRAWLAGIGLMTPRAPRPIESLPVRQPATPGTGATPATADAVADDAAEPAPASA